MEKKIVINGIEFDLEKADKVEQDYRHGELTHIYTFNFDGDGYELEITMVDFFDSVKFDEEGNFEYWKYPNHTIEIELNWEKVEIDKATQQKIFKMLDEPNDTTFINWYYDAMDNNYD